MISDRKLALVKRQIKLITENNSGHIKDLVNKLEKKDNEIELLNEKHKNELLNEKHKNELMKKDLEIMQMRLEMTNKSSDNIVEHKLNGDDLIIEIIKNLFEFTNDSNDKISVSELTKIKNKNKNLSRLSAKKFKNILENKFGLEQGRNNRGLYWKGLKIRK